MKRIILTIFLSQLMFIGTYAQAWLENLPQAKSSNELTLNDYQKAFNDYWEPYNVNSKGYYIEKGVKKKAAGWKQFKRWEWDMEGQVDPKTGKFPEKSAQEVYNEYTKSKKAGSSKTASWTVMGPDISEGELENYANLGRINCIAFHPTDNHTYWVGAPGGGLWVTRDNGSSWNCLTDDNDVMGISDIVIPSDYATSKTIYIATGDRDAWDNLSVGVLKSTDEGLSWEKTGLSASLNDHLMVNRLLLHPDDDNTIIAATNNGVYKTIDGGETWNTNLTNLEFKDMEYKPGDFNTLYGSTTYGYNEGEIYVSSNGGSSWNRSIKATDGRRVELAVTKANPSVVYAVVGKYNSGLEGIYKSTNSGVSFTQILNGNDLNILGYSPNEPGGQAGYDLAIEVSPNNENTLFVGGILTWRSTDGGTNWSYVNRSNNGGSDSAAIVHVDKHMLKYRNNGDLFECNDGGLSISPDDGTEWVNKTNGMVISQMYRLGVSQTVAGEVITGLQDNGTKLKSNGTWTDVGGGDGMECIIDYTDRNVQYNCSQNGHIYRTRDGWSTSSYIKPLEAGSGAWTMPYLIDPNEHNTLYAGYKEVWKTTDQGDTWEPISNVNFPEVIRSLAVAPSNSSVLFAAENCSVWKTCNGGKNWIKVTNNLPVENSSITSLAVNYFNDQIVWVSLSGYNADMIYESIDGGETWINISAGLPQLPAYSIVQNKKSSGEVHLYLGTELGVYFKKGNEDWIEYNSGLPNVKIGELDIYYDSNINNSKLIAATYGRGAWQTPLEQPLANMVEVKTHSVGILSKTSAQLYGEVVTDGGSAVTERGFVWATQSNPTVESGDKVISGNGLGTFLENITDLLPATSYYVRAYAANSSGIAYGTNIVCKTECDAPETQASNLIIDQINDNDITISWTNNGDPVLVIVKKDVVVNWDPESGITYNVNSNIKLGEDIGAANIAVYSGTDNSITITGLNDNTTYHFAVFKYNEAEMCYNIENPAIGNATTTGYCAASGGGNIDLDGVILSEINNINTGYQGYGNYLDKSTKLQVGKTHTLTIQNDYANSGIDIGVWIDFNDNKSFDDAGENVICAPDYGTVYGTFEFQDFNLTIPADVNLGSHRMRVRIKAEEETCGFSCGETLLGEVEDYTIILVEEELYNVTINVKDEDGYSLEGAEVSLTGYGTKQTDQSGNAIFYNISPENDIEYKVNKEGYLQSTGNISVVNSDVTEYVNLLKEEYSVTFVISDLNGLVQNANVVLENYGSAISNTQGEAIFNKVAPNSDLSYEISKDGYDNYTGNIEVIDQNIKMEAFLTRNKYIIKFTISDQAGNIEGAEVSLDNETKTSDNSGSVSYSKIAGDYDYLVKASGYEDESGIISLIDQDINKTIVLSKVTSISVIEDDLFKVYPNPTSGQIKIQGDILQNARIYLIDMNGKMIISKMSEQAIFELDLSNYSNGSYILKIEQDKDVYKRLIIKQ